MIIGRAKNHPAHPALRDEILFYSSDLPELVHVADRVLVLKGGEVVATLAGERITEEAILRAAVLDEAA